MKAHTNSNYITVEVRKLTGPNVHPDDDTLEGPVNNYPLYRWCGETDMNWFVVEARHGSLGQDESGNLTATFRATPTELKKARWIIGA